MANNEIDFADVIHLLSGDNHDLGEIYPILQLPITKFRITYLTQGRDPEGLNLRTRVDSINHAAIYIIHANGQVRFSMESDPHLEEGQRGRGFLVVKFQEFLTPSFKSTITIDGPWQAVDALRTVGDIFRALSAMGADEYTMHESGEGCRSWVRDVTKTLVETRVTNLLAGHAEMGWKDVDPSAFVAITRAQQTIEISLLRLDELSEFWFSTMGPKRGRPPKNGEFDKALPNGEELIAELRKQAKASK